MTLSRSHGTPASLFSSSRTAALVAFLLRLAVLGISQNHIDIHLHHYQSTGLESVILAHALVSGHGYAFPYTNFAPTAWLAPVYVWVVTLGTLLFPTNGRMVTLCSQLLNILFSALTCCAIFILGKQLADRRTALLAAWAWAFLPVAILMPIAFTWDQSLAALQLTLLFIFSYQIARHSSPGLWCAYGLSWGVAALTNPSMFVLFPIFAVWFWLWRRKSRLSTAKPLIVATLGCILVLLPWTVRNWYRLGGFTFVKSNFGMELWLGNNPNVVHIWTPWLNPQGNEAEFDRLVSSGELNYNRSKEVEALSFIRSHPTRFAWLSLERILDNWTAYYDARYDNYIRPAGISYIYIFESTVFSLATLTGLITCLARDFLKWLPPAGAVLIFPIPYYLTHTSQRYRHPIDPILTVLAVCGILRLWELSRSGQNGREAPERGANQEQTQCSEEKTTN
jgi:4-amino-4-deoxy-L-arabinose transferase-like glycosyltransferase